MLKNLEQFNLAEVEEKVLRFWKERDVFRKSVDARAGKKGKPFVFYEGPPTANGRPGFHHVLSRAFKDVILRYKTMRGYHVPRRAGWDTHGLPVELQVEKELGLKSKKEIEEYGVAAFNKKCKESVWKYRQEWERLTERMGYWLDMKDPYITYENGYIERLWEILGAAWKKKFLYKGYKVLPWCTRCGTALSSHELAQGYQEVTDTSVYVKFKIQNYKSQINSKLQIQNSEIPLYILSWTTTPWTLPGNVGLAVGDDVTYVIVQKDDENLILAKNLVGAVLEEPYEVVGEVLGKDLVGLEHEQLFDVKELRNDKSHKIYAADFVTTEDGTGVVHTAVMYGEDDYVLGVAEGLPQHHTVGEDGKFIKEVHELAGKYVRSKEAEQTIFDHLEVEGYLLKTEPYTHDYPHCWRCSTALLYYARESWFIAMSRLRDALLKANKTINWIPAHIREGRMGEWLREVKDWAISRDRYWGTPLPIWECDGCDATQFLTSREEIDVQTRGDTKTEYFLVRHGEATHNTADVAASSLDHDMSSLTDAGRAQVAVCAKQLKRKKIGVIFSSPFKRSQETAQIIADTLGIQKVHEDARLGEIDLGVYDGKPNRDHRGYFSSFLDWFSRPMPEGESLGDVAARMHACVRDIEKKHRGERVLLVSHDAPLWMLETVMRGAGPEEAVRAAVGGGFRFGNAEMREVRYLAVPRDERGFGDVHKPYIDEVTFSCGARKCSGTMRRVPQVVDVWFDSGAMPWASLENARDAAYPADYICEAVDQTRGWFYTLLAIAVFQGKKAPYKNVISLGHILDSKGKKMSKSKGNIVDPWEMVERYGADVVRWHLYTVNAPGEPKRFDEEDLKKVSRRFFNIIYNSFVFYDTYACHADAFEGDSSHVLDRWVLARLDETNVRVAELLDAYDIGGAARMIEQFVDDVSRWYIRRSRARFQRPTSQDDHAAASWTLEHVLSELSLLMAPFAPFFSESVFQSFGNDVSLHCGDWPEARVQSVDDGVLVGMAEVRRLAALALAARAEAGVKVRQPLASLTIRDPRFKIQDNSELLDVLKDEVNVKAVVFGPTPASQVGQDEVVLDTNITHELMEEGLLREFIRVVQGMRQDADFEPKDEIMLMIQASGELDVVLRREEAMLKEMVHARAVEYRRDTTHVARDTRVGVHSVWIGIRKLH